MGIVGVSGRGQFVCHGSMVMAGWRCPEADASSRWLIVIRTDLFLPTPSMIAVPRGESDPLAELAQLTGQSDPFGTAAKTPLPLQSRANVRPQYAPAEAEASAPAGSPPRMQRARQESPPQQEYEEPEPKYPSPVPPLHRYAAPSAAASEQDHHEPQRRAAWPYQIRRAGKRSRSGLSGRSLRPSTRLRQDGGRCSGASTGRGGDGSCLNLSSLCWLSAQRRAADHQSRQQRDQCGAGPV